MILKYVDASDDIQSSNVGRGVTPHLTTFSMKGQLKLHYDKHPPNTVISTDIVMIPKVNADRAPIVYS